MTNSKTLKISYETSGFDKIRQQLQDLEKQARSLTAAFKQISVGDAGQAVRKLSDSIKEAATAQQMFNERFKQYQTMAKDANKAGGYGAQGYGSGMGYGNMSNYQGGFSKGTDTSPYAAAPTGFNWGKMAKWGAAGAIAGTAIAFGSEAWAQNTKLGIHEKMAGMNNYAAAQSFRNQQYQEAVSSPIGYVGFKNWQNYGLRNKESDRTKVDENGRPINSNGTILANGTDMQLKATEMSGEAALQDRAASHFSMKNLAGYGGGLAKVAGGVGAIGMGVAAGGVGALLTGGAGIAAIVSGLKDIKDTYIDVSDKQIEANSGALEASQSAIAEHVSKLQDQMMNPNIAHTLSEYQGVAPALIAGAKATQGRYGYGMFSGYGMSAGEEIGLAGGLTSQFGARAAMGRGGLAQQAAAASTVGFSNAGAMLGQINAAHGDERETMTKLMAEGVKRGLEGSVQFIEKLGGVIAESSYSRQSGATLGGDLQGGLFAGLNKNSTINDVMENASAGAVDKSIFQGNAYFQAQGLADAISVGSQNGIDMNATQAGALQKATLEELAAKSSGRLDSLFGSKSGDIRKQVLSRRIERLGGYIASGDQGLAKEINDAGGFDNYLHALSKSGASTAKLSAVAGQVLGEENFGGLNGYFRVMGGRGELGKGASGKLKGIIPGLAVTSQSSGIARTQKSIKEMAKMLKENTGAAEDDVRKDPELAKSLGITVGDDGKLSRKLSDSDIYKVAENANTKQRDRASSADGYGSAEDLIKGLARATTGLDVFAAKLEKIAPMVERASVSFQRR